MGRNVENNLNIPVDVYLEIDGRNKVPAIKPKNPGGNHRSRLEEKGSNSNKKPMRNFSANAELKLIFEMREIPESDNGIVGIKAALGKLDYLPNDFVAHHFEFVKKSDNKYWAVLHFRPPARETDVDPNTQHPGGG